MTFEEVESAIKAVIKCNSYANEERLRTAIHAAIADTRAEERAPMACGHPRACWVEDVSGTIAFGGTVAYCIACAEIEKAEERGRQSLAHEFGLYESVAVNVKAELTTLRSGIAGLVAHAQTKRACAEHYTILVRELAALIPTPTKEEENEPKA